MNQFKYFILFVILTFSLSILAGNEKPNRIILKNLGYSTVTGGFVSLGYGRALDQKSLISLSRGSWSHNNLYYYGLEYKYFLKSQDEISWFVTSGIQKNEFYNSTETRDSTILIFQGGHQWIGKYLGMDLQSGLEYSDISGGNYVLLSLSFYYRF